MIRNCIPTNTIRSSYTVYFLLKTKWFNRLMVWKLTFYSFFWLRLRIISSAASMFLFLRSIRLRSSRIWSRRSRSTLAISCSRRFLLNGSFSLSSSYLKYLRSCSNFPSFFSLSIIKYNKSAEYLCGKVRNDV